MRSIWHSPAWITAIVGLVSAFLTIPEVVGDYLSKKQDIELAKEQTVALRLRNIVAKQKQEFEIVNNTLAQQGTERVFILRYLAATLDDEDAKEWARDEVKRLDDLAEKQQALEEARDRVERLNLQIAEGGKNIEELERQLQELRTELASKNTAVERLQQDAGIKAGSTMRTHLRIALRPRPTSGHISVNYKAVGGMEGVTCPGGFCRVIIPRTLPKTLDVRLLDVKPVPMSISVSGAVELQRSLAWEVEYSCSSKKKHYECELTSVRPSHSGRSPSGVLY